MHQFRHSWLWMSLGLGLVATVWFLSLSPRPPSIGFQAGDKFGHLLAYGVLMLWFAWLYCRRFHWRVALLFTLQGVLLELIQGFIGYRHADLYDIYANTLGVAAGWAIAGVSSGFLGRVEAEFFGVAQEAVSDSGSSAP